MLGGGEFGGGGGGVDPGGGYWLYGAVGSEGFPSPGGRGGSVMSHTVGPQLNRVEANMRMTSENRQMAKAGA